MALSGASVAGRILFVPAEYRSNYKRCRKDAEFWLVAALSFSIWIVAAIQSFVAPGSFPVVARIIGTVLLAVGSVLHIWAHRVNSCFVPAIIYIPPDLRVKDGPYRFCSHPGYFGFILSACGDAGLLGQWWAVFPMIAYVMLIVRRGIIENRILSGKLQ